MTMKRGNWGARSAEATVSLGGGLINLSAEAPFVFGRADAEGVIGLDAGDMGISGVAGSVEWDVGLWWVVNRSGKRPLILDDGTGDRPSMLRCGQRHAINVAPLRVLVPGAIRTHILTVEVAPEQLACVHADPASTGTLLVNVDLSDEDLDVLVAMGSGYLREFPFDDPRPRTYAEVATMLGKGRDSVRRRVDRIKERLAKAGVYFEGPHANYDLIEYLIANQIIGPADLNRLPPRS